ncbi:MAG: hypothetical protein QOF30_2045, partial [Acidimicrobiaceae bacterium]|nr:hypothetical protein [Acidimicrobiaceae bacterium]
PAPVPDAATRAAAVDDEAIALALARRLAAGDDRKAAVVAVTATLGVPRRRVYDVAVALRKSGGEPGGAR